MEKLAFSNKGNALIAHDHAQSEREVCISILETESDAAVLAMSLSAVLRATPVSFAPFGKVEQEQGGGCTDSALCGDLEWGGPAQPTLDDPDDDPDAVLSERTVRDEDTGIAYPNTDSDTIESETVGS